MFVSYILQRKHWFLYLNKVYFRLRKYTTNMTFLYWIYTFVPIISVVLADLSVNNKQITTQMMDFTVAQEHHALNNTHNVSRNNSDSLLSSRHVMPKVLNSSQITPITTNVSSANESRYLEIDFKTQNTNTVDKITTPDFTRSPQYSNYTSNVLEKDIPNENATGETHLSSTYGLQMVLNGSETIQSASTTKENIRLELTEALLNHHKFGVPYYAKTDEVKKYERIHGHHEIPFKHHLQIVPMEDAPFESSLVKNHRYLVSVLVPVGIGAIGAVMIAATVLTLRHIARKRPRLDDPFDDDVTVGKPKCRISSVCSASTDRVFLLSGDQDED